MSVAQKSLRAVVVGSVAGAILLGGMPSAWAGKTSGGSTTTTTCPRRTTCPAPDTTTPSVSISSPTAGATVAGTVSVAGAAADAVGVVRVEVQADGGAFQLASGTSSWTFALDTRSLTNGAHTITARSADAAGNVSTTSRSVSVANATADTTAPSVAITSPATGSSVSGAVSVAGTAADNASVASVEVRVDGAAFSAATGTTSWSTTIDTAAFAAGAHTITAKATDAAGNATTATANVTFTTPAAPVGADMVIADPRASYALLPLGRTHLPTFGSLTGVLYTEQFTNRRAVAFRDSATGQSAYVDLPADSLSGWDSAATVMTSASDLWIFGGNGPLVARHYRLVGSPMPATAELLESRTFGDADSRAGDALVLRSGAIVFTWGQQGSSGPQGIHVAYRGVAGDWQSMPALTHAPSFASDEVLGQHPADDSVWLFSSPDAWGSIGAAHLTETASGLRLDWADGEYISTNRYELNGPDPENPNLALTADPTTGTLALAYQSADRQYFTNGSTTKVGSRIAVARIPAAGPLSFLVVPVWSERVAAIGLVVSAGDTVVSYRPLDEGTLTFSKVYVSRHHAGAWGQAVLFGTISSTDRVTYGSGRSEFSTKLNDGSIHLRSF